MKTLAEISAAAQQAANAVKAAKAAEKEAKKATKEAQKAAEKAAKEGSTKEAQKAAEKAAAALAEAQAKEQQAAAATAAALAAETSAKDAEQAAKQAEADAKKAEAAAAESLTHKAEAERRSLNAAVRALKETAAAGSPAEAAALLAFAGAPIPAVDADKAAAVAAIKNSDIISAYRSNAAYIMTDADGRQVVAVLKRVEAGANVWQPVAAASFTIASIFRGPAARKRAGKTPVVLEAMKHYQKAEGGKIQKISSPEAQQRIKAAKEEAARQAAAKARAEAQAEADRKAGEAARIAQKGGK